MRNSEIVVSHPTAGLAGSNLILYNVWIAILIAIYNGSSSKVVQKALLCYISQKTKCILGLQQVGN